MLGQTSLIFISRHFAYSNNQVWLNALYTVTQRPNSILVLRQFFRSLWKDFKSRFEGILNDLKRQKDLVQSHANQLHIHNYEVDRLKIFEQFDQVRMKRATEKKAFVVQWIAAPRTILDHEYLCDIRQQHYDATHRRTGQWILDHEEVKSWMGQQVPKSSSLWTTGIAGAG